MSNIHTHTFSRGTSQQKERERAKGELKNSSHWTLSFDPSLNYPRDIILGDVGNSATRNAEFGKIIVFGTLTLYSISR